MFLKINNLCLESLNLSIDNTLMMKPFFRALGYEYLMIMHLTPEALKFLSTSCLVYINLSLIILTGNLGKKLNGLPHTSSHL